MKNALKSILCIAGFFVIAAAPTSVNLPSKPFVVNGSPFGTAWFVNGQWALKLDDFAKLAGANTTLEPLFRLNGNELVGLVPSGKIPNKKYDSASKVQIKFTTTTKDKVDTYLAYSKFHINKPGHIANTFVADGVRFISLNEVAHAFGSTFSAPPPTTAKAGLSSGGDRPTESLSLNFTKVEFSNLQMN